MPELDDEDLNKVDRYVTRVFTLAVKFFGARHAVPSSTIRAELYPDIDDASFMRQFLRDRKLLASLGIVVNEVELANGETGWQVDEQASYVQGDGIGAHDARLLYVLCHDLVFDQAFPYRDELRVALIKIARAFQDSTIAQEELPTSYDRKVLATLVGSLTNHEAVEVRYVDAQGNKSRRRLALLGSFGLRERTYFVASRIERDGSLVPDSVRTYRLDRFTSASAAQPTISYQIPPDFSVHDYEHLPFQIGDEAGVARIDVGTDPSQEVVRAYGSSGNLTDERFWEVPYSSLEGLASWCVGSAVTPLQPRALVDAWRGVIEAAAASSMVDPSLGEAAGRAARRTGTRRSSATDAITKVRQLIALASTLDHEGEVVTAEQVAGALDVSYDQARRLIMLMSMGSGESFDYLPIVIDDGYREVFLMEGAQLSVPRVRLTRIETLALSTALATLGVPPDDPLAAKLSSSYASPAFSADDIARSLELRGDDAGTSNLRICSQAIVDGKALSFCYRPVTGGEASQRRAIPLVVRHGDGNLYLDAFDTMRQDTRVFRIDRMSDVRMVEPPKATPPAVAERHARMVTVRFDDPFYLDLFHWEGLEVLSRRNGSVVARVPYYGGTWLARHLVACAGTVRVADEDIARQAREVAAALG